MWPFRKKKIEVPIPPSGDLLKFPKHSKTEKVIRPDKIKKAVGIEGPLSPLPKTSLPKLGEIPEPEKTPLPGLPSEPSLGSSPQTQPLSGPTLVIKKPFFLRVLHYQKLQKDLDDIRNSSLELDEHTEILVKSEFNENKDYEHLKSELKKIHDRLLFMDDLIFSKKRG